ncbi:uncharacterized protein LOC127791170 isoform X2 [Diospyros lotus]|uniref:uncharacterized protein LOC127791170 isoform X2 n=1 Tax=Diospyros lotus TaxID=55363 RepID=UPI002256629A|nr:uncharacterized protein LOC127791170 isoform X2 [Diospyros lotus]
MAAASLQTPTFRPPPNSTFSKSSGHKFTWVSLRNPTGTPLEPCRMLHSSRSPTQMPHRRLLKLFPLASYGETETTETQQKEEQSHNQDPPETQIQDDLDEAVGEEDGGSEADTATAEKPTSAIIATLNLYKEALASNDESKVAEIEAFLMAVEDEKIDLQRKVAALSEELSNEKVRILRISADFDNFRKRTERDRLSLVTNAQGEVVENLLPVLDNFERAKAQIKVETEGEEKINNSYQSIYKQFVEILGSLAVVPVETRGKPFDPLVSSPVGSKFSRILNELYQTLHKACSGFMKAWIRF